MNHKYTTVIKYCTKENPMPSAARKQNEFWRHNDAKETEADSEYYIEYKCPHCHLVFRQEMPD